MARNTCKNMIITVSVLGKQYDRNLGWLVVRGCVREVARGDRRIIFLRAPRLAEHRAQWAWTKENH